MKKKERNPYLNTEGPRLMHPHLHVILTKLHIFFQKQVPIYSFNIRLWNRGWIQIYTSDQ